MNIGIITFLCLARGENIIQTYVTFWEDLEGDLYSSVELYH